MKWLPDHITESFAGALEPKFEGDDAFAPPSTHISPGSLIASAPSGKVVESLATSRMLPKSTEPCWPLISSRANVSYRYSSGANADRLND